MNRKGLHDKNFSMPRIDVFAFSKAVLYDISEIRVKRSANASQAVGCMLLRLSQ